MPARAYSTRHSTPDASTFMAAHLTQNKMTSVMTKWRDLQLTEGAALSTDEMGLLDNTLLDAHSRGYTVLMRVMCGYYSPTWLATATLRPVSYHRTISNDPSGGAKEYYWPIPAVSGDSNYRYWHNQLLTKLRDWAAGTCPGGGHPRSTHIHSWPLNRPVEDGSEMTLGYGQGVVVYNGTNMTIVESVTSAADPTTLTIADPSNTLGTLVPASRSVSTGTTTAGSTTFTATGASFATGDVGKTLVGPNIPAGTIIESRTSTTQVTMSLPATATGSALTVVIGTRFLAKWDAGTATEELVYFTSRTATSGGQTVATLAVNGRATGTLRSAHVAGRPVQVAVTGASSPGLLSIPFNDGRNGSRTGLWDHVATNTTQWNQIANTTTLRSMMHQAWKDTLDDWMSIFPFEARCSLAGGHLFGDGFAGANSLVDYIGGIGSYRARSYGMTTDLVPGYTGTPKTWLDRCKTNQIARGLQYAGKNATNTAASVLDLVNACEQANAFSSAPFEYFEGAPALTIGINIINGTNKNTSPAQGTWPGATLHTMEEYLVGETTSPTVTTANSLQGRLGARDSTPPATPAAPVVTISSSTQLNVAWVAPTDVGEGVAGYRLFRDGVEVNYLGVTHPTVSFSDTGRTPSTTYTYTVQAFDGAGNLSAISPGTAQTTPASDNADVTPPTQPTGLSASFAFPNVILSWTRSTDAVGVTRYDVLRGGVVIGTAVHPPSGSASYLDSTGEPGQTYSYRVIAYDAAGNASTASSTVSIEVPIVTGGLAINLGSVLLGAGGP
jgi:hypothetical protein